MTQLFYGSKSRISRKYSIFFLAFLWVLGFLFGLDMAQCAGDSYFLLMRGAFVGAVSIVNLLIVSLLPFLLSAIAVYIHSYPLLAVLCFIKSFSFAFVSSGVLFAGDRGGWLIRILFMFSDLFSMVLLWICWIVCAKKQVSGGFCAILLCGFITVCIVFLDYVYVSPFLAGLFEF